MGVGDISPTQKGAATERLLLALAAMAPSKPTRNELIDSPELQKTHNETKGSILSASAKRNASKTLGRMISAGVLTEVLLPNGNNEKLDLPEAGLIAVSVNLSVLNADHEQWCKNKMPGIEPGQEMMAEEIRSKSIIWMRDNVENGHLPIFLKDIWIVHGSNYFDMLIFLYYRKTKTFLNYVRNVVQRVRGVQGTQTMQISNSLDAKNSANT